MYIDASVNAFWKNILTAKLRPYQADLDAAVSHEWAAGHRVVMAVAPTGAGKTILFSEKLRKHVGSSCAIAHRRELISQMSLALARNGVRHRVIGTDKMRKACQQLQLRRLGRHFVDPNAKCGVASVDSLERKPEWAGWLDQVTLWVGDEGHHFLKENKWGKAVLLFTNPNCLGLLVTATPTRADGRGLGADNDGLAHSLVEAPCLRHLIHKGYLTDYRMYTVPSDVDYSHVPVGPSGELVHAKLREAVHASGTFVGNVVNSYLKIAPGKLGITFAVDVESAVELAKAFRDAGVAAEVVHAGTPEDLRANVLARFERREVLQLVNVDLFGEGFDLPAVEVVIMARKTESFSLFAQQAGRSLRVMVAEALAARWDTFSDDERRAHIAASAKPRAILIDHVGNVPRHAVMRLDPWLGKLVVDLCHREWSLDRRGSRASQAPSDSVEYRICANPDVRNTGVPCDQPYERYRKVCPYCDFPIPAPAGRGSPDQVEGDLSELDDTVLQAMFARIRDIGAGKVTVPYGANGTIVGRLQNVAAEKREAQQALQNALAWYGGLLTAQGITAQSDQWRQFYLTFKTDIATVQMLPAREMWEWFGKISAELARFSIDATVNAQV